MIIVDVRGCGRTGQRDGADDALKGCDGSITDRRVTIQVSVECGLLFAQPVENVSNSLRSDLEVKADDGVGSRPFQTPQKIGRYLRVLDLTSIPACRKTLRAEKNHRYLT